MSITDTTPPPGGAAMARRAGFASFIGTSIEWYDFYAYSTAAALVLGKVFFPSSSPAAGTLAAFATFWVGFLARPLGGVVFGHMGDRIGRKKTLIVTLMVMGAGTAAVGLLPTYGQVGLLAPALLVLLRMIQGVAMGGEWGGAVVLASEHAPRGKAILYGAFAQQGSPMGNLLATGMFLLVSRLPDAQFLSWGWRIPFLLSAVLVVVGLFIRLGVEESPAMKQLVATRTVVKLPIREVLRTHKTMVLLGMGACTIGVSATYFKGTFALSWAVKDLGFDRTSFLSIVTIALVVQLIVQPLGAVLASRIDLRRAVLWMLIPELAAMPLMFLLIGTKSYALSAVGMAVATIPHSMYYAALAGILAQSFPANVRYTAISLCYQLSSMLFAGTAPMIGQFLLAATGSILAVIALAVAHVLLTMVCGLMLLSRAGWEPAGERVSQNNQAPAAVVP
ncbi:MFS family permease [Nocardia transvalensis]|uniref:Putative proline/betaine transporter n=1 Tax=Nocardia transvalensis TaxID=37333 RepID=A0A7W9PLH0_9NOCA|nr:MFS transporter [Nocardia transvalensis]MBB5918222.1 MFS family permease [Nocardia transvalensis]